jgi:hypothetical protein
MLNLDVWPYVQSLLHELYTHSKKLSELSQAFAPIAAAAFFAWQVRRGYVFVNLSLALAVRRHLAPAPNQDDVVTVVTLT